MALYISYHGTSLFQLGAYSYTTIAAGAPADAQLGVVALIGEANEGPAWTAETQGLAAVTYSPSQFQAIVNKYGSGELVDGAFTAFNPSDDDSIKGGAQALILMKSNQSVQASKALASSYGTLYAARAGLPGNLTNATITQASGVSQTVLATTAATYTSTLLDTFGSSQGIVPGLTVTGTNIQPGTKVVSVTPGVSCVLSLATTATSVAPVPVQFSRTITQDTITLNRSDLGITEISSPLGGTGDFALVCTDGASSAATLTITSTAITTAVTGGATLPLNIPISQFATLTALVDYINTLSGYQATLMSLANGQQPPSVLDQVAGVNILGSTPLTTAPIVNQDAQDVQNFFAGSQTSSFTPGTGGYSGLPAALAKTYYANGATGATSQANIQTCLDALAASTNLNFLVPLFSRDAIYDIAAGITDPASTYQALSTEAAVRTHVNAQSTIRGRKERQAWVGFLDDNFINVQNASGTLAASRVAMCFQQVNVQNAQGTSVTKQPHMVGVIAAGMKAAAPVGLSNAYKLINASGFVTTNSYGAPYFDPSTDADTAIQANLCYIQKADGGGFEFGIDNSTYGQVTNAWYYSRPSVIYASDIAAKTIRINVQAFVGKRNSDVSNTTVTNFLITVLDRLRAAGIIVPDTNSGGKGYLNASATISGNVCTISVTLVLVEDLEFILNDIQVQRAQF